MAPPKGAGVSEAAESGAVTPRAKTESCVRLSVLVYTPLSPHTLRILGVSVRIYPTEKKARVSRFAGKFADVVGVHVGPAQLERRADRHVREKQDRVACTRE